MGAKRAMGLGKEAIARKASDAGCCAAAVGGYRFSGGEMQSEEAWKGR